MRWLALVVAAAASTALVIGAGWPRRAVAAGSGDPRSATTAVSGMTTSQFDQAYHYQTSQGFMNDVQTIWKGGDGYYHFLYLRNARYRHDGDGTEWYHVKTRDFVHYTDVGVSIPKFNGVWQWMATGSVITNESGFFADLPRTALVAYFTSYIDGVQRQFVAYSRDEGRTFLPYRDTAVMSAPDAETNARDPYVTYDARSKTLVMYLAEGDRIGTYESADGVGFHHVGATMLDDGALADLGLEDGDLGLIECPNLKTLRDPRTGETKSILFFGANGYRYGQTTGTYYMVGDLDGHHVFVPEQRPSRVDDGSDYYGANVMQNGDTLLTSLAWMGNWGYSDKPISDDYGPVYKLGSLSLAHHLTLAGKPGDYSLVNTIIEPKALYQGAVAGISSSTGRRHTMLDVSRSTRQNTVLTFTPGEGGDGDGGGDAGDGWSRVHGHGDGGGALSGTITVRLLHRDATETIRYVAATGAYEVTRETSRIGDSGGSREYEKSIAASSGVVASQRLTFHIVQDQSSVEFYVESSGRSYSMARYTADDHTRIQVSSDTPTRLTYEFNDIRDPHAASWAPMSSPMPFAVPSLSSSSSSFR